MEVKANTIPTRATGSKSTPLQHAFIRTLLFGSRAEGYFLIRKAPRDPSPPEYAAIRMPTLMNAGYEDKSAPLAGCEEIFKKIGRGKRMETVKKIDH